MPSPADAAAFPSTIFSAKAMRLIFGTAPEGEQGAARFRQVGLLLLIHNLQMRRIDATTTKIEEISGASRHQIYAIARELKEKCLVEIVPVAARHKKGHTFKYVIPKALLDDPLAVEPTEI